MREVDCDSLPREILIKLLKLYSCLLLALDGFWFLAAKDKWGYEEAVEIDAKVWESYFPLRGYEDPGGRSASRIRACRALSIR